MTKSKITPQKKAQLIEMQLRGKDNFSFTPTSTVASNKISFNISEASVSVSSNTSTDTHHYLRQDLTKTAVLATSILIIQGVLYLWLRSRGF